MNRTATHSGHCQFCGRLQKLPAGVLSTHGYLVAGYGFFVGTCRGSGYQPFELSCNQVERYITEAQAQIDTLEIGRERLLLPATEPNAWIHHYHDSHNRYLLSGYYWIEVAIQLDQQEGKEDGWPFYEWSPSSEQPAKKYRLHSGAVKPYALLAFCTGRNELRANAISLEIQEVREYIDWQQKRVDAWTLQPLNPVTHKDEV